MRPSFTSRRMAAALASAVLLSPLAACSSSAADIETHAAKVTSVTDVKVGTGKDGGQAVTVSTASSVTVEQVLAVFSALADDLGGDDTVTVVVDSPSKAKLTAPGGTKPKRGVAEALLIARDNPDTTSFVAHAGDTPRAELVLGDVKFKTVMELGDQIAAGKAFDTVDVSSGKRHYVITTQGNNSMLRARAELVSELDADFPLLATTVTGSGKLELVVEPRSLQAVKVFLDQEADNRHGVVTVTS